MPIKIISLFIFATVSAIVFQNCGDMYGASQSSNESVSINNIIKSSADYTMDHPLHLLDSSSLKGNIYFDGKNLTGIICSDSSPTQTVITLSKSGSSKTFSPAYSQGYAAFESLSKYFKSDCGSKKYSHYFSHVVPKDYRSGGRWSIDGVTFKPIAQKTDRYYGIQYTTYHCPFSSKFPERVFDISKGEMGPVNFHHWIGKTPNGYYCLQDNPTLIRKHAVMLMNAGIDYIYIDMTNDPIAYEVNRPTVMTSDFYTKIHLPIKSMFAEYNKMQAEGLAVPKVTPWIGTTSKYKQNGEISHRLVPYSESISRWVNEYFFPQSSGFRFRGHHQKPILFAKVGNKEQYAWKHVEPMLSRNADNYDTIVKWSEVEHFQKRDISYWTDKDGKVLDPSTVFRFMESCEYDESLPEKPIKKGCNQFTIPDQISVVSALQRSEMWMEKSIGKRKGRTLYQQFLAVFSQPEKRYISVANWNNWLSNRYCHGGDRGKYGGAPRLLPPLKDFDKEYHEYYCDKNEDTRNVNGELRGKFVDSYSYEYSRVLEPGGEYKDCSYALLRSLITSAKNGATGLTLAQKNLFASYCDVDLAK